MRAASSILYASVATLLLGCSDSTGPVGPPDRPDVRERPSTFTLSPASATIQQGESRQFTTVYSGRAALTVGPTDVAWESSDPSIASVTPSGVVRGVSGGQARIVAFSGGYRVSALVTVTGAMKKHEDPTVCLLRQPSIDHPTPSC